MIAWQKAKELCILVYTLTENLPIEEKYNFCSQIRRSAQSVTSNLAEGSAKRTYKDKAKYVNIAFGSLSELNSQFIIANELFSFSNGDESDKFFKKSHELINILSGLLKSFKEKIWSRLNS